LCVFIFESNYTANTDNIFDKNYSSVRIQLAIHGGSMNVEINTKKINAGFMMQLKGDVDITTSFVLKQNLDKMLKRGGAKALLINLSDVRYIDSVGVWVLAEASKNCMTQGMKLRLVEPSAPVRELFRLVSLESLIEIFTSENEACEGL